jgi:peptidyl-prolyl cis-trans isomerase-like protein 2
VCNSSGIVFENAALTQFLLTHKQDPVTGEPMTTRDIITLHMDQDDSTGEWQCPVLTKPFADHSKIVAIRDRSTQSAYVYSWEAYKELNVKAKNYTDLTTGKPYSPKTDVLIINDNPENEEFHRQRDISTFWHIRNARNLEQQSTSQAGSSANSNVRHSVTATRIMEQFKKEQEEKKKQAKRSNSTTTDASSKKKLKIFADDVTGVQYTSGKTSGSFTSTSMDVAYEHDAREANEEEILNSQFKTMKGLKKKGYVRLKTNLGDLVLELHCDIVMRTCTNFLGLCEAQKYNGTKFHRLIPNFMIQGGKSTSPSSGKKEEESSLWGGAFRDEFDDRLKHSGGGILSMANAGANTNKQQFFLTFKSCAHLDRKHSIFGKVVDGMDVLKQMEQQPADEKDRPLEPIILISTEVLVNPAKEAEELERQRIEERGIVRQQEQERKKATALGRASTTTAASITNSVKTIKSTTSNMVGKYLPKHVQPTPPSSNKDEQQQQQDTKEEIPLVVPKVKPPQAKTKFGDFSGW